MAFPFGLPQRYVHEGPDMDGGQGTVYLCRDTYLDRKVAIKVLTGVADEAAIRKELSAMQAVRSRHVAQVYDFVVSGNKKKVGLVQEFVPGPTVTQFPRGAEPTRQYLLIIYQIACGIADIHSSGKIHRDIKPSNIRLDSEGVVKILDFGFASDAGTGAVTTDARGTPCYIAPELYVTPPVKFTSAVDVFAFGVTARVILEGGAMPSGFRQTPPYSAPLPDFSSVALSLSSDVVTALNSCLKVKPNDRPTMPEVRDVLAKRLLFGKHKAVVSYNGVHELSSPGQSINLKHHLGSISIGYDGLDFRVTAISGSVSINNLAVGLNRTIAGSCVITLGDPVEGAARRFVPFNVSHPGVVL